MSKSDYNGDSKMKRTVTDVPDSNLNFVIALMRADKATVITLTRQKDGLWTVKGEFVRT